MQTQINYLGRHYKTNLAKPIDLSYTYGEAEVPEAWGVEPVKIEPFKAGDFVGAVKEGASVNFFNISFNPHGNGTHTECFGHISAAHEALTLSQFHFVSRVVSLAPEVVNGDFIVRLQKLKEKIKSWNIEALIVHVPWDNLKYTGSNPPYFEAELLAFISEMGVQHFLTNMPSVDREDDGGKLAAHKAFWDFPAAPRNGCTITEMIKIPQDVCEGLYLLNLQVAPFKNDAAPSRPLIYPLEEIKLT